MKFQLFNQVALSQDIPEYGLKKGSIGTIVEHYPTSDHEDGYSIEGLIPKDTVEVTESQIEVIDVHNPFELKYSGG
jgi:hypothetical protein